MSCRYKIGFLSLSECGGPVVATCGICNRPVCLMHSRLGEAGHTCLDCVASQENMNEEQADKEGVGDEWRRDHAYRTSGYGTGGTGATSTGYHSSDYDSFDNTSQSGSGETVSPSDLQDS